MPNELSELEQWLKTDWKAHGPTVAVVEGFSGVGKTSLGRAVVSAWGRPAVLVTATKTQLGRPITGSRSPFGNRIDERV